MGEAESLADPPLSLHCPPEDLDGLRPEQELSVDFRFVAPVEDEPLLHGHRFGSHREPADVSALPCSRRVVCEWCRCNGGVVKFDPTLLALSLAVDRLPRVTP